jgi:cytochrome P450
MSSDSWDYSKLKTVTYLDSVINETLRLKPPIIQGLPRETPAQGIHVGETYIPGNVIVSVPTILIQRDSRWWKQPNEFIPERFTERKVEMETADAPWIPFQIGEPSSTVRFVATNGDRYARMCGERPCVHDFAHCNLSFGTEL